MEYILITIVVYAQFIHIPYTYELVKYKLPVDSECAAAVVKPKRRDGATVVCGVNRWKDKANAPARRRRRDVSHMHAEMYILTSKESKEGQGSGSVTLN